MSANPLCAQIPGHVTALNTILNLLWGRRRILLLILLLASSLLRQIAHHLPENFWGERFLRCLDRYGTGYLRRHGRRGSNRNFGKYRLRKRSEWAGGVRGRRDLSSLRWGPRNWRA